MVRHLVAVLPTHCPPIVSSKDRIKRTTPLLVVFRVTWRINNTEALQQDNVPDSGIDYPWYSLQLDDGGTTSTYRNQSRQENIDDKSHENNRNDLKLYMQEVVTGAPCIVYCVLRN